MVLLQQSYSDNSAISFAAAELTRAMQKMGVCDEAYRITLGLFSDMNLPFTGKDAALDDEFAIEIHDGRGYIAASNPRSVLFGVYHYLEICGVSWIRPDKNGTWYPNLNSIPDASVRQLAATRYRSVCIEGADSIEHVLDMIDWMPKLGFNSYYIQFRDAFIFFDRWYSHRRNPIKKPEPISRKQALLYVDEIKKEIKKRGLFLEAVGHGWTCEPFGIAHTGWDKEATADFPQEYVDICAMTNGKRHVWNNTPLQTQLCMSNPSVRKTMNDGVIAYIRENPEVDVIYYWLGDYFDNTCECDECKKLRYSDYYVMLLNELDEVLSKEGLNTRIVFSTGYNLANPPIREKLNPSPRFEMMFAPITRTFADSFPADYSIKEIPPYHLNHFKPPVSTEANLAQLYVWKQYRPSPVRLYDYHLMWDHLLDASNEGIARVLYDDIRNFKSLGIDGFTSCQLQRNAFPTAIAMFTMGKTLWNTDADFDTIRSELYRATFGPEHLARIEEYFAALSKAFSIGVLRCQKSVPHAQWRIDLQNAMKQMDEIRPLIQENISQDDQVRAESWRLLELHRQAFTVIGQSLLLRLDGHDEEADKLVLQAVRTVWEHEDELQHVLDCYYFEEVQRSRVSLNEPVVMPELNIDF